MVDTVTYKNSVGLKWESCASQIEIINNYITSCIVGGSTKSKEPVFCANP